MKILTLFNFFSTYLLANSINIEVRSIHLFQTVSDISPVCFQCWIWPVIPCSFVPVLAFGAVMLAILVMKMHIPVLSFLHLFLSRMQGSSSAVATRTTGLYWWVFVDNIVGTVKYMLKNFLMWITCFVFDTQVCTSRFWFNYRHVANTLSVYRSVKRLGIPDR